MVSSMIYARLVLGVFSCSTAVIFIKLSTLHPVLLASYRTLLAALVLSPLFVLHWRRHLSTFAAGELRRCVLPALVLAVHFISWNVGARLTAAANASLIVNLAPLAMPFLLYFLAHERVTRREVGGTLVALLGVLVLTGGDLATGGENVRGNLISFASMLCFAGYLALGRGNRAFPSIWLYVVPIYALTGLFCLAYAFLTQVPFAPLPFREWAWLLALVFVPTVIGHTALNHALKHLRGQIVSIVNLGQFFFAGLMALFLFAEWPAAIFYPGCVLILAGAWLATRRPNHPPLTDSPT